ncbi:MAG: endonuclease domain-containing protein [Phycisphaerales bacterium]|nr:endonuclease domain-containing protein [Phycisphaerales bacterium]
MARSYRIDPELTARARCLRRAAPFPERLLWNRLRAKQVGGLKFRRQHPIGRYIADFYCAAAGLVIELDGMSHDDREEYDAERTRFIESQGLRVVRFTDDDVIQNVEGVVSRIACECGLET